MLTPFKNEPITDFSDENNRKRMQEAISKVESILGNEYPLVIDGERVYSAEKFESYNPSEQGQVVGILQKGNQEHAEKAIKVATERFKYWSNVPPEERAMILLRAATILRERKHEFAAWQIFEVGKNWLEADADVAEAIDYLEFYAREMIRYAQPQPLTPIPTERNEYFYIPLGPVVVIPPWNFPLAIMLGMTTAALVTGNTVVLKPSSDSAVIAYKFVELMEEAGLPKGVLNLITGPGSTVGDYLVTHPLTRMIAFTGSKEVGIRIYEQAAKVQPGQKWLKRVIAEMGGKDVIIVDTDADLEDAARATVASAFGYQGQKCSAASRLVLIGDIYEDFVEKIKELTESLSIGPAKEDHPVGPVINAGAEEKILSYIEIGKQEGKLVTGGEKAPGNGYFIKPTIFKDVDPNARIAQEEIFGPVLAVIKAKDFDDALEIANNTEYGLTGSLFTFDPVKIARAKREFHVGNLYINRKCTGALVDVHPFGGFNMSGTDSKAGGRDYLLLFMQGKSVSEKYR